MKYLLLAVFLFALPGSAAAAETSFFASGGNLLVNTPTTGNVYAAGGSAAVTTPVPGDLTLFGGSLVVDAPVSGDVLLAGGSLQLTAPVSGDARLVGGSITITKVIGGDLVALGGSVTDLGGKAQRLFIVAGEASLTAGAGGPVTVYGNTVTFGGTFAGDVEVVASGRLTLLPETVIKGELRYRAPQEAVIHESAVVTGGVHYTGASYLPSIEEARAIALASFGIFLFVKVLGVLILAGLAAGVFPAFAERVARRATQISIRRALLMLLLGFGVLVATPVLLILLAITFVGLGLAFVLGLAYLLLIPLAFIYAAIVAGSLIAHFAWKRDELRWSDAVLGMLLLFILWSIPVVGWFIVALATVYLTGVLTLLLYRFAFPRDSLKELEG